MPDKSVLAPYRSKLGKVPDQQIADLAKVSRTLVVNYRKKLGIAPYQGYKAAPAPARAETGESRPFRGRRSALDAYTDQLGKVPDAEIARLAGVTAENVRTYRHRRNIPATWQGAAAPAAVVAPKRTRAVRAAAPPAPAAVATEAADTGTTPEVAPTAIAPATPANGARTRRRVAAREVTGPTVDAAAPAANGHVDGDVATNGAATGTAYVVTVDTDEGPRTYALVASDIAAAAADASARVEGRHPGGSIRSIQRVAEVFPE